ncbi:hypothetical protein So717_00110 [Roseobacter cerasinus]|uniref:Uncharacterized protein n=1 Tax=Roseobacter cerasinus TaxID=2602289 RepID=A0A640VI91_9RHOB|nr:hypothetical protein [Roseobacter cerasinus]GFE48258.1 hypothetical protein So717_00110 [Roseobacter cerasinus]
MALDAPHNDHSLRVRLGNPGRLLPETRELTLLILGHLFVFLLSMGHDEIVAEMVEDGWFIAQYAERFEILLGFGLFLCWSALTLRLVSVLQRAKPRDEVCAKCGHDGH